MQLIKKSFSIMKPWLNNNICNKMVVGICTLTNKEICLLIHSHDSNCIYKFLRL